MLVRWRGDDEIVIRAGHLKLVMEVQVQGNARATPFLRARDAFQTEFDLERPVKVYVRTDPDERTWTSHESDHHRLNISAAAARGGMARELALHEYAHMYRHEEGHPSHEQSTKEAIFLAGAGRTVSRDRLTQCYQIANHMKDVYADDLTLRVTPAEHLIAFLESSVAGALADTPSHRVPAEATPVTPRPDPAISAVNAAFAMGLLERHGILPDDHHLHELARITATDAPGVPFDRFRRHFRTLPEDPDPSTYRHELVDVTRTFLSGDAQAAD